MDENKGAELRDEGMKLAEDNANRKIPGWSDGAYRVLETFLENHNDTFMTEDVRAFAALIDFELPPNARAWGSVIMRAAKNGLIHKVGFAQVKNKKAHRANAALWAQRLTHC